MPSISSMEPFATDLPKPAFNRGVYRKETAGGSRQLRCYKDSLFCEQDMSPRYAVSSMYSLCLPTACAVGYCMVASFAGLVLCCRWPIDFKQELYLCSSQSMASSHLLLSHCHQEVVILRLVSLAVIRRPYCHEPMLIFYRRYVVLTNTVFIPTSKKHTVPLAPLRAGSFKSSASRRPLAMTVKINTIS